MIIYKATNKINGKCYIGQTIKSLRSRRKAHINRTKHGSNLYFCNAIRKYKSNNFKWEILCECESKNEMDEMEFHYIKQYKSHELENGYNMTIGGDKGTFGWIPSKETRKRMSNAKKDFIPWNKGKTNVYSQETKDKWSKLRKGKVQSTKLKEFDVRRILDMYYIEKPYIKGVGKVCGNGKKMSYKRALALKIHEIYNVSTKCIEKIIDGETWKYVQKEYKTI